MPAPTHITLSDLRGFHRLTIDATIGLTDLVESMHHTILKVPGVLGKAPEGRARGITGFVYRSVRGVTRIAGAGVDALLGALPPLIAQRPSSQEREAVLAALNGVLGDYLAASANPLAIPMRLRVRGKPLTLTRAALAAAFPAAPRRIVVMMHGLCMNDGQWLRDGHDHGAALARDCGYAPVYLHYNTGLHIAENARECSALLEALVAAWPARIEQLAIVGHSMGGLLARSACDASTRAGHAWSRRLGRLVFLGTPHHGAPLERAGAVADFLIGISPYTAPFARLGKLRSAGIKDLRYGNLRDEDWQAPANAPRRKLPLPRGTRCFAIAGSRQKSPGASPARVRGDGLVPVASALGRHRDAALDLGLPDDRCHVSYGTGHFGLLSSADVYARLRDWLRER